jgi:hypothetical protein
MTIPTTPMIEQLKAELDELLRENAQIGVALSEQDIMIAHVIKTGMSEKEVGIRAEALNAHIDEKQEHLRLAYLQAGVFELTIKPHGDEQDDRVLLEMVKWEPSLVQLAFFKEVLVSTKSYPEYYEQVRQFSHREYHNVLWLLLLTDYLDEFDVVLFNGSVFDLTTIQKLQHIPNTPQIENLMKEIDELVKQRKKLESRLDATNPDSHMYSVFAGQLNKISLAMLRKQGILRLLYLQEGVVEVGVSFHSGFGDGNIADYYYLFLIRRDDLQEQEVVYADRNVCSIENNVFFKRLNGSDRYSSEMLRHLLECSNFLYGSNIILFGDTIYDLNKVRQELQN